MSLQTDTAGLGQTQQSHSSFLLPADSLFVKTICCHYIIAKWHDKDYLIDYTSFIGKENKELDPEAECNILTSPVICSGPKMAQCVGN